MIGDDISDHHSFNFKRSYL